MKTILLALFARFAVPSFAQDSRSLEQTKEQKKLQNVLDTLNKFGVQLDIMTRKREADCAKAIGYAPFCGCILKNLSVAWNFAQYIAITTHTKEENGYDKMDAQTRAA